MAEQPAVMIRELRVRFGRSIILPRVDLDLSESQIIGIFGPSGAGKTTLVRAIMGMCPFTGEVRVFGRRIPSLAVLPEIGYMAQSDALYEDLSAAENLLFFGSLYGMRDEAAKKKAAELLEFVGLGGEKKKDVRNYSGGMKRRLSLAAALMHSPRLLILDEPTIGIDPLLRKKFWDEFLRLKGEGRTILMTTHVMDEARHCDDILLLRGGNIIANGTLQELLTHTGTETMEDAFLAYSTGEEGTA